VSSEAFIPEINVVMMRGNRCNQYYLGGSVDEMAGFLQRQRELLGISYIGFTDVDRRIQECAGLVERLAGA
jgi:hypothetical protein